MPTDDKTIARAEQAARLLNDPLYAESFEAVRQGILSAWERAPARDTEGRERLHMMLKALNDARGLLERAINDGKVVVELKEKRRLFGFK